jgi:hypothetical protein
MAKTHFTTFGEQYRPSCADKDGFITYSVRDVAWVKKALAAIPQPDIHSNREDDVTDDVYRESWRSTR